MMISPLAVTPFVSKLFPPKGGKLRQNLAFIPEDDRDLPPLVGEAPAFRAALAQVSQLAALDRPVLVVGERGTGKELVAARLTYLSPLGQALRQAQLRHARREPARQRALRP